MIINCKGEELVLSKERALFWKAKSTLIISDLHIGKSAHFRKFGIQVPATVGTTDLQRLCSLVDEYTPDNLIITGDMFHNTLNSDVEVFEQWRKECAQLNVILIKGNHDALKPSDYSHLGIETYNKELIKGPFRFIHDKPKVFDEYYNISGHIHPGVTVYGKARQRLKFPCFYFSDTCAVLPAFSVFTGLSMIPKEEGDRFYAITPTKVVAV